MREFQKQLAVKEMDRKFKNDAILAQARLAEAKKDLAQAEKERALAMKKPPTVVEKFQEAKKLGVDDATAWHYALGVKPADATTNPQIEITPGAAEAAGLPVPTKTVQKDVKVPSTDLANETRTVPVTLIEKQPIRVPPSIAMVAGQAYSAQNRLQQKGNDAPGGRGRIVQSNGQWAVINPDGTARAAVYEDGTPVAIQPTPMRQRGGSGAGGSSEVTARQQRTRTFQIEQGKNASFRKIMADIEKNPDDVERHVRQARDAQQAYEDAIEANGGTVSDEAHNQAIAAVEQMVRERAAQIKSEQPIGEGDSILGKATSRVRSGAQQQAPPTKPQIKILEVK